MAVGHKAFPVESEGDVLPASFGKEGPRDAMDEFVYDDEYYNEEE